MEEEWRDIEGYEGLYQVSNLGRVRSMNYRNKKHARIMSPTRVGRGYKGITLWKDKNSRRFTIHKLVAMTFLPNPCNKENVHHIDGNMYNNAVSNLEWVTIQEHSFIDNRGDKLNKKKAVCQYTVDGVLLNTFCSMQEAQRQTGVHASNIIGCCRHRKNFKTAGGFTWKYVGKEDI